MTSMSFLYILLSMALAEGLTKKLLNLYLQFILFHDNRASVFGYLSLFLIVTKQNDPRGYGESFYYCQKSR